MQINIDEFENVLNKGTMNYMINSIGLTVYPDKIKCNMISNDRNALLFLNIDNKMIKGLKNEVEFNFSEPNTKVKKYLNIIEDEEVDFTISDEFIKIDNKIKINFDHEDCIEKYGHDNPTKELEFFKSYPIDENFLNSFNKIKKVGNIFGKIYFIVEDNQLYIESTDKLNKFSNSVKFPICEVEYKDISLCFIYKNMVNLMSLINEDFSLNVCFVEDVGLGCIGMFNSDKSERYYLMSIMEG
jgi:hypothetical protein